MARQIGLGKIAGVTAGTPVQVSATDRWCESYMIEPWPTNTGKSWIGTGSADFRAGTTYLLGYCPIPHANVVGVFSSGKGSNGVMSFNLKDIYVDFDNSGEAVIVTCTA